MPPPDGPPQRHRPTSRELLLTSFNAGIAYAVLLMVYDWWQGDPLFGSPVPAFLFRAAMFGGFWYAVTRLLGPRSR